MKLNKKAALIVAISAAFAIFTAAPIKAYGFLGWSNRGTACTIAVVGVVAVVVYDTLWVPYENVLVIPNVDISETLKNRNFSKTRGKGYA